MERKSNAEIAEIGYNAVAEFAKSTGHEIISFDQTSNEDKEKTVKVVNFMEHNPGATPEEIYENTKSEGAQAYSELSPETAIATGTFIAKVKEELFGVVKDSARIVPSPTTVGLPEGPESEDQKVNRSAPVVHGFKNHATNPPNKPNMTVETIAELCHEANKTYCESIGDNSQPIWKHAPEWQKESAINGVKYHLANPDSKPEDSHNNWMREKEATGWKYGAVKDVDKKEHPCFRPYAELPEQQRRKDEIFIETVRKYS